jgi:hypothetical protein
MERGGARLESAVPGGVREEREGEEAAFRRMEEGRLEAGVEKGSVIAGVGARGKEREDEEGMCAGGGMVGFGKGCSDIAVGGEGDIFGIGFSVSYMKVSGVWTDKREEGEP